MNFYKKMILIPVFLFISSFDPNVASANSNIEPIENIKNNMSQEDFNILSEKYSNVEIISIISEEINNVVSNYNTEFYIKEEGYNQLLQEQSVTLTTESGYNFKLDSKLVELPTKTSRSSENFDVKFNTSYTQLSSLSTPGGTVYADTSFTVSSKKLTGDKVVAFCDANLISTCESKAPEIVQHNDTSFTAKTSHQYTLLTGLPVSINLNPYYSVVSVNNTNKTVKINVSF